MITDHDNIGICIMRGLMPVVFEGKLFFNDVRGEFTVTLDYESQERKPILRRTRYLKKYCQTIQTNR